MLSRHSVVIDCIESESNPHEKEASSDNSDFKPHSLVKFHFQLTSLLTIGIHLTHISNSRRSIDLINVHNTSEKIGGISCSYSVRSIIKEVAR